MKYLALIFVSGLVFGCGNSPYQGLGNFGVKSTNGGSDSNANPNPADQNQDKKAVKTPGEFKFVGELNASIDEGKELVQKIEISDADNPNGPFQVFLDGFPGGTWFQATSPTTIEIHFKPGYDFVVGKSNRVVEANLHALNADSRTITSKITWTVNNVDVAPLVAGPEQLLQTSVVNFSMLAEDLNGESFPKWKDLNDSSLGTIKIYEVQIQPKPADPHPRTELDVAWTTIPTEQMGKNVTLKFQACVGGSKSGLCTTHKVAVQLPSAPQAQN